MQSKPDNGKLENFAILRISFERKKNRTSQIKEYGYTKPVFSSARYEK